MLKGSMNTIIEDRFRLSVLLNQWLTKCVAQLVVIGVPIAPISKSFSG